MASLSRLAPMASLSKLNGNFIKAPKRPFYRRLSNGNSIKAKPNGEFIKANPMAVLSKQALTARVNHRQWPLYKGLQFSSKVAAVPGRAAARFQLWRANPILRRASNLSTDNCFIKAGCNNVGYRSQWPLYQSQWPFYQGRPILAKEEFRGKNLWV